MDELEKQLTDVETNITIEQFKEQKLLTKEKVINYLTNSVLLKKKQMLQTLIQKIVAFDDKIEIYYNFTEKENPDDDNHLDSCFFTGSTHSRMVDRNHTNSNPFYRFSEKWFCAVVDLPEKL